jgi:hypothetical protein
LDARVFSKLTDPSGSVRLIASKDLFGDRDAAHGLLPFGLGRPAPGSPRDHAGLGQVATQPIEKLRALRDQHLARRISAARFLGERTPTNRIEGRVTASQIADVSDARGRTLARVPRSRFDASRDLEDYSCALYASGAHPFDMARASAGLRGVSDPGRAFINSGRTRCPTRYTLEASTTRESWGYVPR